MKNIRLILGGLTLTFMFSSFALPTINSPSLYDIKENIKVINTGEVLCVENMGYSRITVILWYKNEAVSKISVGGGQESCFEIGDYEYDFQWKASEGMNGSKKGFYGGTATFY